MSQLAISDAWVDHWGLLNAGAYAGPSKDHVRRTSGQVALTQRFIQTNPVRFINAFVIDIDRASAIMDALERPHEHPDPSWVIETNRGAHVGWWLKDPVCRSEFAALKPLRYAARVQEGLVRLLDADPAYTGFITRNPVFPELKRGEVIWGAEHAYTLAEMRTSAMPRQLPRKVSNARADLGRNCALFEEGRHEVYRLNRLMDYPQTDALYRAALSHLLDLNSSIPPTAGGPLSDTEVRSIASSIARWTVQHHTRDGFIAAQKRAGTKSAEKRWGESRKKAIQEALND